MGRPTSGLSEHFLRINEPPSKSLCSVLICLAFGFAEALPGAAKKPITLAVKLKVAVLGMMDSETFSIVGGLPNHAGHKTAHQHTKFCLLTGISKGFTGF